MNNALRMKSLSFLAALPMLASSLVFAKDEPVLNVYTWSAEVPEFAVRQFEKETGIEVNFSTYDSNEVMFAKLKANKNNQYDVIEPSSYYIDRMSRQSMLQKLDKQYLPNFKNIDPSFLKANYDPTNDYSIPFVWGVTGIFYNKDYIKSAAPKSWADLWSSKYASQLLMLDDSREIFSIGLLVLGYSANDTNPEHIKQAYLKLKEILPNIKLFNSAVISLLIDEDATVGMVWNGDLYKAKKENKQLEFVYPSDRFVIWVDNFAIPTNAPHKENAYKFINFMMRADVARDIALDIGYPTPNLAAKKLLPEAVQNNKTIYPSKETLSRGEFQTDIGDDALTLYEKYWEQLKIGG